MAKIRLLHIIKTLELGGAEANLLNFLRAHDPNKVESYVAYSVGGQLEERFKREGVRLFKFSSRDHKLKSLSSIGIIFRLAGFIKKNRINIVQTHTFNAHVWGGIAAKLAGARIIEHVHDSRYVDPHEFIRRQGKNRQFWAAGCMKNFSDAVVVLTRQNRDYLLQNRLYPASKIRNIHNGIPLENTLHNMVAPCGLREKLGVAEEALLVFTPSRLSPEKNIGIILKIAPRVIASCPQTVFLVAGDGPLAHELNAELKALKLEKHVMFTGFRPDVRELLDICDIFLLPSLLELHSIAMLEAMSMSKPIVASSGVGCHEEFIRDWENGVLLDPFVVEGWAEAIVRLGKDAVLRKKIGLEAYRTCANLFDINRTARQFEELYEYLAG